MPEKRYRTPATKGFKIEDTMVVRIFNVLASNIHVFDKKKDKKVSYQDKKLFDENYEITEAIRTEDLQKMVEHINSCNRQVYRQRNGHEPPCDYIDMKVNDYIFKPIKEIQCPSCNALVQYYDIEGPKRIKCQNCGKEGIIR